MPLPKGPRLRRAEVALALQCHESDDLYYRVQDACSIFRKLLATSAKDPADLAEQMDRAEAEIRDYVKHNYIRPPDIVQIQEELPLTRTKDGIVIA